MHSVEDLLSAGISELRLEVESDVVAALLRYLHLLQRWNRVYNLTAIREASRLVTHHILDSLAIVPFLVEGSLIDVGSGAGLPGIPVAIARPRLAVTLLDSNHKKTAFLKQAVIECGLSNVAVETGRAETLRPDPRFDMVVSRAFSDLGGFVESALHLVRQEGLILAMKGVHPDEELAQLPASVSLAAVHPLRVPGLKAARHLVVLQPGAR